MFNRAERHAPQPQGHCAMNGGATANKELIDFFYDALEHKNDALVANMPAARPRTGEFQKSESVSFMSAVDGGDRHAQRGMGRAQSLSKFFAADFLLLIGEKSRAER